MLEMMAMEVSTWGLGLGAGLAGIGAGIVTLGAAQGLSTIASKSVESMARQPDASSEISNAMLLTAAMLEGVALFAALACFLAQMGWTTAYQEVVKTAAAAK